MSKLGRIRGCKAFHAAALTVMLEAGPATAHDWYSDLKTPQGLSCCSDRDCHPVGYRYSRETGHEIEILGYWVHIDPSVILPVSSPDGQTHACYMPSWSTGMAGSKVVFTVHCVILGGMS
jgi:hypothetical protein